MAGSKADTFEVQLLKLATGQAHGLAGLTGVIAGPYLALYTVAPTDATPGTEVDAVGTTYARVDTAGMWGAPSGTSPSTVSNSAVIAFPVAVGAGWGTLVAFALFDAAVGGNRTYWADLIDATKAINVGDTPTFPVDGLVVTED